MEEKQFDLICKVFKLNKNDFELNTTSFRIISDHNMFRLSFDINEEYHIIKDSKGISVIGKLDIEKLVFELAEKQKELDSV